MDRRAVGCCEVGGDAVELLGGEFLDFVLALHNQSHGHRLHAAGRKRRLDFLPQHRRELEAHDAVEHAAGLLCVDEVEVDVARVGYGVEDGILGDFVEYDAAGILRLEFQHFVEVPGDSFPFAVLIGSEPYGLGLAGVFAEFGHKGFLVVGNFVDGLETVAFSRDVDAEIFFGQVANVAVARLHKEVGPEKFSDGLGFGRRLYDNKIFRHRYIVFVRGSVRCMWLTGLRSN